MWASCHTLLPSHIGHRVNQRLRNSSVALLVQLIIMEVLCEHLMVEAINRLP